jgi:predicted acetyltransferase
LLFLPMLKSFKLLELEIYKPIKPAEVLNIVSKIQPYFFSYADPSEKFWSLKSKPSIVKTFYELTIIKLHSKLIFFLILLEKVHQNKKYIHLKTEIFHLGRHRKKNTAVNEDFPLIFSMTSNYKKCFKFSV